MTSYIDSYGREWEAIDFRVDARLNVKHRVEMGTIDAHGRAFRRASEIRVYWFGFADRSVDPDTLRSQFRNARPIDSSAAAWQLFNEQMDG